MAEFVSLHIEISAAVCFPVNIWTFWVPAAFLFVLGLQTSVITLCTSCEEALDSCQALCLLHDLYMALFVNISTHSLYISHAERANYFFVHFCAGLGSSWSYLLAVIGICSCPAVTNNKQPISLPMFVIWNLCYTECKNCSSLKCCVFGLFNSPPAIH